ncbi:class I adenylate-forming enzyme family protein [Microbacterium testaceum]|uniref:class I adenylate-forming enzyme family protein n=1 Tax=Microbacterium testaceum TaxID=2033 RepID=UPI002AC4B2F3|nr:class I adenylate-forming enzyme family protein [Microbacterium testaceum]MDZ5143721.1 acyl--CoA ligase [Microbacterium testaceum]
MIVVVDGAARGLPERIRDVRAAGDAVLIADPRWSDSRRAGIARRASGTAVPAGTAWATLTSGSSGAARIVLRTAESWEASFDTVADLLDVGPDDILALPSPPAASLTLFSLAHAAAGGPRVRLGVDAAATCLHGTPENLRAVLDRGAPDAMRVALVGGSAVDPALRARAEAAGVRVIAYYGAAELSFVAVDLGDGLRAFPGAELDVRGGEVWVRSAFVASGYLGSDGPLRRAGRWATVGDRAEWDDGRLRLRGRRDGAILSASATVVPEDVEVSLREIPGVRDAVVFGMPRPGVGALVAALVEIDAGAAIDLRAEAAERLAPSHRPRRWFVGEIPRTPSGKPARAEIARQVEDAPWCP